MLPPESAVLASNHLISPERDIALGMRSMLILRRGEFETPRFKTPDPRTPFTDGTVQGLSLEKKYDTFTEEGMSSEFYRECLIQAIVRAQVNRKGVCSHP